MRRPIRWALFGVIALLWIAVCWFFGSMAAVTDSGPQQSIAQQTCGQALLRQSGGTGDYWAQRDSDECRKRGRAVAREASRPALRKGLLIGVIPVLLIGVALFWSDRRRAGAATKPS